ncbi:MAG TPA: hypothetical protein VLX68_05360 [Chitinivibrionales bacterium]|nr:hypothetical protein [Chitinivibrionales bacterium]
MKTVCAWCGKLLDDSDNGRDSGGKPISHGICPDCARRLLLTQARPLRRFLNRFAEPVFLVNAEGRVIAGNAAALSALGKKPEEVDDKLGGDAIGCRWASLPGGCGKTVHCKTCTIRNTVTNTINTGKSNIKVPAYPDLANITGDFRIRFLITTEKAGEGVLLRIDEIKQERA